MAWTVPACIIWAVTYVTFGSLAAGSYRALADQLHWIGYVFVAAVVLFALAVFVVKKLISRAESRHWDAPGDGDANTTED
jgi:membrane protein DedA with SNARE-associated domain